jgi:two-component system sensor histidine kinase RegB
MTHVLSQQRDTGFGARAGAPERWYRRATPPAARPWLVRLRWITVLADVTVLGAGVLFAHADFPLGHLLPYIAVAAVGNAALAVALGRERPAPVPPVLGLLLLDVVLLTGVLELTGGPLNPFAVIYAVHVALAAVSLGTLPALLVGSAAMLGYSLLFYRQVHDGLAVHHRLNDFPTHVFAMWIALAALAELAIHIVWRASAAVEAMHERAARSERVVSLTTLAAGAAHELSTPLGTIAVAARELELALGRGVPTAQLGTDARLIRVEVDRCRAILDQMSGRAGGIAADVPESVDVRAAIAETISALPQEAASRVRFEPPTDALRVEVSRAGLRQAILSLMTNALDASGPDAQVVVSTGARDEPARVRIAVHDRGPGMPPTILARAGEPFFTTKDPGRGLGLGLFLARVFAERHGGALAIETNDGTVAWIELPAAGT